MSSLLLITALQNPSITVEAELEIHPNLPTVTSALEDQKAPTPNATKACRKGNVSTRTCRGTGRRHLH